ncbi:MAG: hypothetical protein FVQ81_06005 [Candidatus Glassbacteria bacterium]|nr:hypothetical protein [Candidatus Glassbacteria bacterium]
MRLLTIDCGTSRIKAGVFHTPKKLRAQGLLSGAVRAPLRLWIEELTTVPTEGTHASRDRTRIDVDSYMDRVIRLIWRVVSELKEDGTTIDALCPAFSCPSLVALDNHLRPLHPALTHVHRESMPHARELVSQIGWENWLKKAGNLPLPGSITASSMRWLAAHQPHVAAVAAHWVQLHTVLLLRLTGELITDHTQAAYTGLYDCRGASGWLDDGWLEQLGVSRSQLPEIVPADSIAGKLTRQAAAETGLKKGIPVITGGADIPTGLLAAEELQADCALNMSGSSEIVAASCEGCPEPGEKYLIRPHLQPGRWTVVVVSPVGGETLCWFRDRFCREISPGRFWDWVMKLEESVDSVIGSQLLEEEQGESLELLPHLFGDMHSFQQRKAGFVGLTSSTTREDMLCAVLAAYRRCLREAGRDVAAVVARPLYAAVTSGGFDIASLAHHRRSAFYRSNLFPLEAAVIRGAAVLAARALERS